MEYSTLIAGLVIWRKELFETLLEDERASRPQYAHLIKELDGHLEALQVLETNKEPVVTMVRANPIDKYGCQLVVCRLHEQGEDTAAIANHLSGFTGQKIRIQDVEDWLEQYKAANLGQRSERRASVFDTTSRMESLYTDLNALITSVKQEADEVFAAGKTTRWEVLRACMSEMRALTKDARDTVLAIHNMNNMRATMELIVQEIALESPSTQQRIYARLERHSTLYKLIGI